MSWFKVDDGFYDHPKVRELLRRRGGRAALGLWVLAGSFCARHLLDGRLSDRDVRDFGTTSQARLLVDVGLWARDEGGYVFHEWTERNPTRKDVEEKRAQEREKKRRWRERSRGTKDNVHTGRTEGVPLNPTRPDPTRPDPTNLTPPDPPPGGSSQNKTELAAEVNRRALSADDRRRIDAERVVEALTQGEPNGRPPPHPGNLEPLVVHRGALERTLAGGVSAQRLVDDVHLAAEMVDAGELEPSDWTPKLLTGFYASQYRDKIAAYRRRKGVPQNGGTVVDGRALAQHEQVVFDRDGIDGLRAYREMQAKIEAEHRGDGEDDA